MATIAMTGKERVIKALNRQEPDRVPTLEWVIHPKTIRALTGQDSLTVFIHQMGIDGINISPGSKKEKVDNRHYRVFLEALEKYGHYPLDPEKLKTPGTEI